MAKKYYITTPIYYPSSKLHIGHTFCSVATDAMARFKKQTGYDTFFLTGTDEHGQKIENKAREAGVTPQEYVDNIVVGIKELWRLMDVDYSDFIRTTDERHVKAVQKIFMQLYEKGDIYKGSYEGLYCTPCEAFWTPTQAKDGNCPDCGRPVQKVREEAYFLKISKYQDWLIDYIRSNPDFIQPASRANEMLQNFLLPGLDDLCISRSSFTWGIPVPIDEKHVIYVWLDALSNYITALGYGSDNTELYDKYWPADKHIVGKEISGSIRLSGRSCSRCWTCRCQADIRAWLAGVRRREDVQIAGQRRGSGGAVQAVLVGCDTLLPAARDQLRLGQRVFHGGAAGAHKLRPGQ